MKTYEFKKAVGGWRWHKFTWLCGRGIRNWVNVPRSAKKLYITVSKQASKQAYAYKLRPVTGYYGGILRPGILLQLKNGRYENSHVCQLEDRARNDKWPKTGYIKVEYSE